MLHHFYEKNEHELIDGILALANPSRKSLGYLDADIAFNKQRRHFAGYHAGLPRSQSQVVV